MKCIPSKSTAFGKRYYSTGQGGFATRTAVGFHHDWGRSSVRMDVWAGANYRFEATVLRASPKRLAASSSLAGPAMCYGRKGFLTGLITRRSVVRVPLAHPIMIGLWFPEYARRALCPGCASGRVPAPPPSSGGGVSPVDSDYSARGTRRIGVVRDGLPLHGSAYWRSKPPAKG